MIQYDKLKYTYLVPGLQIPSEILVYLDNDYVLYHKEHPPSPLYIFRKDYNDIPQHVVDYYVDLFAFLHDQPTFICSSDSSSISSEPLFETGYSTEQKNELFFSSIYAIYNEVLDRRLNGSVLFFHENALDEIVSINLSQYQKVPLEMRLYNSALKQPEPFIEFFLLCRVIECICKGLKPDWLNRTLKKAISFEFDPIFVFSNYETIREDTKVDYYKLLKERVGKRIKHFEENGINIGKYYFDEIRNSIAHGANKVYEQNNFRFIVDDCFVLRLICRYGIVKKTKAAIG